MQHVGRKCFGGFLAIALGYVTITGIVVGLTNHSNVAEQDEDAKWIASSKYWVDRQMCRWLGMCGTFHLNRQHWTWDGADEEIPPGPPDFSKFWESGEEDPNKWSDEERALREIPQYVYDHAPYVHLFSEEHYWPCDLAEHLVHTTPRLNYTKITDLEYDRNLTNLYELNDYEGALHGRFMYLQSNDNVEDHPSWLSGQKNIPNSPTSGDLGNNQEDWPDIKDSELDSESQQADIQDAVTTDGWDFDLSPVTPSEDGRCGGHSGFACKGSRFGKCCSMYGWCGRGEAYCGQACDPIFGACNDPFEPVPRPHSELRKRYLDNSGKRRKHTPPGRSSAPAILVVVPKDDGIVDAFWFFFYSFNLGQVVFNIRFGNHVGDWEHTVIRFQHGEPISTFLSEHDFGSAYAWHALEKYLPDPNGSGSMIGSWSNKTAARLARRPVVYSAVGTHAMYATPGLQPYILPWGILHDQTDRGPLWDPSLNAHSYTWDHKKKILRASTLNPNLPTGWFHFAGHWGDKYYPLSDPRQYRFAGQYHYVNGPTGPRFKNLGRDEVCQGGKKCHIRNWVDDRRLKRFPPQEDVEEGGLPGGNSTDA